MKLALVIAGSCTVLFGLLSFFSFRQKTNHTLRASIFAVLSLVCLLAAIKFSQFNKMMSMAPPMMVETVSSVQVQEDDWAPVLSAVGSVSPVQGATVAAELGGVVNEINFENGAHAKKGDLLIKLDTSSEEAQLRSAEADAALSKADVERSRDLAGRSVVSKAELDAAEAKFKQKSADADNMRALISKKQVRAPFEGELGIRQVNVGQMIPPGQAVVPLQALEQVYVDFSVPQQRVPHLQVGFEVRMTTDALPGREFTGKLTAINSAIDTNTRSVFLQATLDNQDRALRPGMFAKVEVTLPEKNRALIVPGTAVSYAPYGNSVFVIEKKKDEKTGKDSQILRQQFVRVGEARGDFVAIEKGVETGQTIVSSGVFKLRNGTAVTINNDLAPKPQVSPTPADT